jgi:hypothetical protein
MADCKKQRERGSLMMLSEGLIDCNYVKQICFKSGSIKIKFFFYFSAEFESL